MENSPAAFRCEIIFAADAACLVTMSKNDFKEYLCRPYCVFFKDGQKEAIACRGARVAEVLVRAKRIDMTIIPPLTKESRLWEKYKDELGSCVCSRCSFRAEDCDFQSGESSVDIEPCGGFILLAHLRGNNLINQLDLEVAP